MDCATYHTSRFLLIHKHERVWGYSNLNKLIFSKPNKGILLKKYHLVKNYWGIPGTMCVSNGTKLCKVVCALSAPFPAPIKHVEQLPFQA